MLSFLTLAVLEIVLGIDNLLFVQIVASRCDPAHQMLARRVGLLLALGTRLLLLASIAWVVGLTEPFWTFDWFGPEMTYDLSWRDVILLGGGLFLLAKATTEIHHHIEGSEGGVKGGKYLSLGAAVVQIAILDIVFSLDSVITAVGMADHLSVMVAAVIAAMIVMIAAAGPVGNFVDRHPTVKMLALSFLLLIGMALLGEGLHFHIPKAYLYFAIAFSVLVEMLNLWARKKRARVKA
ncbi:MAG: TerC family protein [Rhodospirillaceae bacterium]|nr:TerC family protein [Rhodospirillaceae bacterium]